MNKKIILLNIVISLCLSSFVYGQAVIPLQRGLNLVSIPFVADNTRMPNLLQSIHGNYNSVFVYNANNGWSVFVYDAPSFLNSLSAIDSTKGFWINMSSNDTLIVSGTDSEILYEIKTGWNLISFPSQTSGNIDDMLADVNDSVISVHEYNAADLGNEWKFYQPGNSSSTLTLMLAGLGYWLKANKDDLWSWNTTHYHRERPDLQAKAILSNPLLPIVAQAQSSVNVELTFEIRNTGRVKAEQINVLFYDDFNGTKSLIKNMTFPEILPQSSRTDTTLVSLKAGIHNLSVIIDPYTVIEEEDELNNVYIDLLNVLNHVTAFADYTPKSGEVPLMINFTGYATDGIQPYVMVWLDHQGQLHDGNETSLIFSEPDVEKYVSFLVSDALIKQNWTFNAWVNFNFTLQNNSLQQDANFSLDIYDIKSISDKDIRIYINISNSAPIDVDSVRVRVEIYNITDPFSYSEVLYDNIRSIAGNSHETFTIIASNLQLGNYSVDASINPNGAVPEVDSNNPTNNFDSVNFYFNGLGYMPPIILAPLEHFPNIVYPGMFIYLRSKVYNYDLFTKVLKGFFRYYNGTVWQLFSVSPTYIVEPGENIILGRMFHYIPPIATLPLRLDLYDILDNNKLVARTFKIINVNKFDFSINPDLYIYPAPGERTREVPLIVKAEIKNKAGFIGDVDYTFKIDDIGLLNGTVRGLHAHSRRNLTFELDWVGVSGVIVYHNNWSYSGTVKATVEGLHNISVELHSIKKGTTVEDFYDSNPSNNNASSTINISTVYVCEIDRVFINPATVNKLTRAGAVVTNGGFTNGTFRLVLQNYYYDRDLQMYVYQPIFNRTNFIEPSSKSGESEYFIPAQVGKNRLIFDCITETDTTHYVFEYYVQPEIKELQTLMHIDPSSEEYYLYSDYDRFNNENRLRLFTKAQAWPLFTGEDSEDISSIKGSVYKTFMIDDGTNLNNTYNMQVVFDGGFIGFIDTVSIGFMKYHEYKAKIEVGLSPNYEYITSERCPKNKSIVKEEFCKYPIWTSSKDPLDIQNISWEDLPELVEELQSLKPPTNYWDAVQLVIEYTVCEAPPAIYHGKLSLGVFKLKNKEPFNVYINLDAWVKAISVESMHMIWIDFYNLTGYHYCDDIEHYLSYVDIYDPEQTAGDIVFPKRGLWIDDVEFDMKSMEWADG